MPLRYAIRMDQAIEVQQSFDSPTVYLDHWAIRRISEMEDLQRRFVEALHKAGGTLFLSYHNFAEFAGPEDPRHAEQAEGFLERVLPNIYIGNIALDRVIEREQDPQNQGRKLDPPPDIGLLRHIASKHPTGVGPFTIKGVLTETAANRERLGKTFNESNQRIADKINAQRNDPEFVRKAREFKPDKDHAPTSLVMAEILRGVVLDSALKFSASDASDYQHAIVSTSYCDYTLLDGKWKNMIQQMERRTALFQLQRHFARCFSERQNGLEDFLRELESWPGNRLQ